jgi:hypothetical protein
VTGGDPWLRGEAATDLEHRADRSETADKANGSVSQQQIQGARDVERLASRAAPGPTWRRRVHRAA